MSPVTSCILGTLLLDSDRPSLARAAKIINSGGLVAFPTETVYGLGAAASDSKAVKKIFSAKGRPADNPLIVHLSEPEQLKEVARKVPDLAHVLTRRFWPGPLSLVLQRSDHISAAVSAGLPTVAVRMPDHQVALDLIRISGVPIAAPSANRSGRPSPTNFKHVLEDLAGRIDAVIRSETCPIGVESTVLSLTGPEPVILRPGGISREALENALGCRVVLSGHLRGIQFPVSPGTKYRHYSPRAPLILLVGTEKRRRRLASSIIAHYRRKGFKVGHLNKVIEKYLPGKLGSDQMAAHLYRTLRELDHRGVDLIVAEETDTEGVGLAVMNRLRKAAARVLKI